LTILVVLTTCTETVPFYNLNCQTKVGNCGNILRMLKVSAVSLDQLALALATGKWQPRFESLWQFHRPILNPYSCVMGMFCLGL